MSKYTKQKTTCPKKFDLTAKEVASIAGCSVSTIKQIRAGNYPNLNTPLAKRVMALDSIANNSKSLLIKELEKVVKL